MIDTIEPIKDNAPMTKLIFVAELSKNLKNTIHLADTKANLVLTIQTFLISTILATTILADIFKNLNAQPHFIKYGFLFVLVSFLIVSIIGLMLSIYVFMPRKSTLGHNTDKLSITFYEQIKSFSSSLDYYKAINALSEQQLVEELSTENYNLSFIITKKMHYTRKSILALFTSIMLAIIIVFFVLVIK